MNDKWVFRFIILFQILISFGLGIFGNKIADVINLNLTTVLSICVALILGSLILTVYQLRIEKQTSTGDSKSVIFKNVLFGRVITVFPVFLLIGLLSTYLSIILTPNPHDIHLQSLIPGYGGIYRFEIVTFVFGIIILVTFDSFKHEVVLLSTSSIGYAIGVITNICFLDFRNHNIAVTIISWLLAMIIATRILRTNLLKAVINDIHDTITNLTKER